MIKSFFKNDYINLVLIYLIFLCLALNVFRWVIDDLYIYFRYVNNFTSGKGIVYNPGEFVEGFSSFSWFLILSLFKFIGFPLELSSKIAGLVLAFLSLVLLFKISIQNNLGKLSYVTCCLMLFNLPFILWSISGFEIMFYIFLLLYCFYMITNSEFNTKKIFALSFLLFLISLSRPEGILFSVVFIIFIYVISKEKIFTVKVCLLYSSLFGLFLLFRYFYFGDILPNTYYAKIGHSIFGYYEIRSYKNGVFYIIDFFKHNIQFILLFPLILISYKNLKSNKIFLFTLIVIFIQFFFVIFSGGDWMVQYRFIVPAIPFLSLALAMSLKEFLSTFILRHTYSNLTIIFIFIIISGNLILEDYKIIKIETSLWNNLKELSAEMKSEIPSKTLVANGSSGVIPFYLDDVNFLDIVGLTNKHIAKNGFRHGTWFEKSLPNYIYEKNPQWLIMWKKKNINGNYTFENASPCYKDLAENNNFNKYILFKSYDVYDDIRIELYKLR